MTQITSPFPAENYSHGKRFLNPLTFYWLLSAGRTLFPAVLKAPSPAFNPWRLTGMNRAGGGWRGVWEEGSGGDRTCISAAQCLQVLSLVLAEINENTPNLLLNRKHLFSHGSVARKSRIRVLARPCSLGKSPHFWGWPAVRGVSWLMTAFLSFPMATSLSH